MESIIVFGAGGRAGRRVVTEALRRGHRVTSVVRDVDRYPDLGGTPVSGDVTDPTAVAALAKGHDTAVNAAALVGVPDFFTAAARALTGGLVEAGVPRLVGIGVGTALEVAPGVPLHDTPDFPAEYRDFSLGHAAQLDVLRAADPGLDWVLLVPPPTLLDDASAGTGHYRTGGGEVLPAGDGLFAYADLALAVVDETETPRHHRAVVAIGH
jgi:uncharacterized protein